MIGYAVINSFTFGIDMLILTIAHKMWGWPVPIAATTGYATALAISFVLNRTFNFQVHGHLGQQAGKFAVVVIANWLIFVLGVVSLLVHFGVEFQVARFSAACMEGIFLYCMMRFAIFNEPVMSDNTEKTLVS